MFDVQTNPDGTVNVANVPIFGTHQDRRYNCDETWLDRCVADFMAQKLESIEAAGGDAKYAMLPSLTIGHTPEDPNAPEPHCEGFLDNVRRVGRMLYCDLVHVSKKAWDLMRTGKLPYRSAEVIPSKHRITNLSLLGGRYPHFALPVMRFRTRMHGEVLRYTLKTETNDMPQAPNGQGNDLVQLAEKLAPMVADILTNKQAEAAENDLNASGASDDTVGSEAGVLAEDDEPAAYRSVERTMRQANPRVQANRNGRVDRHSTATVKADGKRVDGFADPDFQTNTSENEANMTNGDFGQANPAKSGDRNVKQDYAARLAEENAVLREQVQRLTQSVGELQRHRVSEAQASKRIMLRSKCESIAAMGYAIGDKERIERHVDRMMGMSADDIRGYFNDVLKAAPRVNVGASESRYGTHDLVHRPGRVEDENERYAQENPDSMRALGLNAEILRLADVLGDGN